MPNNYAILAEEVYKHFGDVKALDGVSIAAETGKVLGLLGPNGAGKTTLVRILTTLLKPDKGTVTVGGLDVLRQKRHVREIIGLAGQNTAVDEILTGRENLVMVGQLYHMPRRQAKQRAQELLEQFSLIDAADRSVKTYSGGMRRRLDLAASIVARPNILFMDEPTTGLDPRTRIVMWDTIRRLFPTAPRFCLPRSTWKKLMSWRTRLSSLIRGMSSRKALPMNSKPTWRQTSSISRSPIRCKPRMRQNCSSRFPRRLLRLMTFAAMSSWRWRTVRNVLPKSSACSMARKFTSPN